MATPSSVKRATDSTGDDIATIRTSAGAQVQVVAGLLDFAALDVAEVGAITYVGKGHVDGRWLVQRIDTTDGTVIRYAGAANNESVASYAAAWAARAALTYGLFAEAI